MSPHASFISKRISIESSHGRTASAPSWDQAVAHLAQSWDVELAEKEIQTIGAILSRLTKTIRFHENMFLPPDRADSVATHTIQAAHFFVYVLKQSGTFELLSYTARRILLLSCLIHDTGEILGEAGSVDNRNNRTAQSEDVDFESIVVEGTFSLSLSTAYRGEVQRFESIIGALQEEISPTLLALKTASQQTAGQKSQELIKFVRLKFNYAQHALSDDEDTFHQELHDAYKLVEGQSVDDKIVHKYQLPVSTLFWQAVLKSIDRADGVLYALTNTTSAHEQLIPFERGLWFDRSDIETLAWTPSTSEGSVPFSIAPSYIINSYLQYCESYTKALLTAPKSFQPLATTLIHLKISQGCSWLARGPQLFNLKIPKPDIQAFRLNVLSPFWDLTVPKETKSALQKNIRAFCEAERKREETEFKTISTPFAVEIYLEEQGKILRNQLVDYSPAYERLLQLTE